MIIGHQFISICLNEKKELLLDNALLSVGLLKSKRSRLTFDYSVNVTHIGLPSIYKTYFLMTIGSKKKKHSFLMIYDSKKAFI